MPLTDTPTRAELDRASSRRPDVVRRADQIRRRRVGAVGAAVMVVLLAAAIPFAITRSKGRSEGVVTTAPPNPATTTPSTSATTEPPSTSTATTGTTMTFNGLSLVIPPGWTLSRSGVGVCLAPSPAPSAGTFAECAGLWLVSPHESPASPVDNASSGHLDWYPGTGLDCPFTDPGAGLSTGHGTVIGQGLKAVGHLTAEWEEWAAGCVDGPVHHVQVWFLPTSNVLFLTSDASPQIARILASVGRLDAGVPPFQAIAGEWGGHETSLRIQPDGTGVLVFADLPPCSASDASRPCHPAPPDGYILDFTLMDAVRRSDGTWSADATIDGDNSHGDRPSLEGMPVHLVESGGRVTITEGGFVAGFYPNGQLCRADLRPPGANSSCP